MPINLMPKEYFEFLPTSPNKAILPSDLKDLRSNGLIVEEKYDGSLYMARFLGGAVEFVSRRISVKSNEPCNKTNNLPHINRGPGELHGTLLVGEIRATDHTFKSTMRIMGSSHEKALAIQEETGFAEYTVFDCIFYRGVDQRDQPLAMRRVLAEKVVKEWKSYLKGSTWRDKYIDKITLSKDLRQSAEYLALNLTNLYDLIVSRGGEGLMLKDANAPYGQGVTKCKKVTDVSVVVMGFTEAKEGKTGKYKGQIGAVRFGVYVLDELVEIGQCSGMEDEMRQEISRHPKRFVQRVMDVACQPPDDPKKFKAGKDRLRHPRFLRFRDDLAPRQCTETKLIADFRRSKG